MSLPIPVFNDLLIALLALFKTPSISLFCLPRFKLIFFIFSVSVVPKLFSCVFRSSCFNFIPSCNLLIVSSKLPFNASIGFPSSSLPITNSGIKLAISFFNSLNLSNSSLDFFVLFANLSYSSDIFSRLFTVVLSSPIADWVSAILLLNSLALFSVSFILSITNSNPLVTANVAKPKNIPFKALMATFANPAFIPREPNEVPTPSTPTDTFLPPLATSSTLLDKLLNECIDLLEPLLILSNEFKNMFAKLGILLSFPNDFIVVNKLPIVPTTKGVDNPNLSNTEIILFITLITLVAPSTMPLNISEDITVVVKLFNCSFKLINLPSIEFTNLSFLVFIYKRYFINHGQFHVLFFKT